ncbi:hypothetical protein [Litchfieldia alkalitelluris]|uniref:Uncharacterized protein n=2 Tax=Evansella alkalicola TaxID=745819 RepID=A0ABS6JQV7_9BACI|nr:hypothetical protein [Litchfieldia alkalitelluris]MBU9720496.1 hypothetical protein [Bacillus alkalicola]
MEKVIQTINRKNGKQRLSVLRMELDYELLTLFDALQTNDQEQVKKCKQKLERLRREWIEYLK